eukprot:GHUV01035052.1.p1 GENE.GHUV01035052.1~~GHUV01035052.1.p1  ORF type:complete len:236 (+),score=59.52 GHUV01035052.1:306-1013(+)
MLPASNLDGLLCSFDHFNSGFALGTPDGRVRTYDAVTGRLRSTLQSSVGALSSNNLQGFANGHLAEGHNCLTWLTTEATSFKAGAGHARSWVAVGTSSGAVKCYDSATGEVQWQAVNCNEGGVQCLAYSSSRSSVLLSSGRDGQVCTLDLATGSKQAQFKGSKHSLTAAALSTGVQQQQRVFSWHIISLAPYLVSSGRASGRNVLCQWGPIMRDHAGLQRHTQTSNGPAGNARCL